MSKESIVLQGRAVHQSLSGQGSEELPPRASGEGGKSTEGWGKALKANLNFSQQRASAWSGPRAGISSLGKKGVDQLSLGSRPNI